MVVTAADWIVWRCCRCWGFFLFFVSCFARGHLRTLCTSALPWLCTLCVPPCFMHFPIASLSSALHAGWPNLEISCPHRYNLHVCDVPHLFIEGGSTTVVRLSSVTHSSLSFILSTIHKKNKEQQVSPHSSPPQNVPSPLRLVRLVQYYCKQ